MLWDFVPLITASFASAALALTITKGSIFWPLRSWLAQKSKLLGHSFGCAFCMLHWTALVFVLLTKAYVAVGFFVAWFFVVGLGFLIVSAILALNPMDGNERQNLIYLVHELKKRLEKYE